MDLGRNGRGFESRRRFADPQAVSSRSWHGESAEAVPMRSFTAPGTSCMRVARLTVHGVRSSAIRQLRWIRLAKISRLHATSRGTTVVVGRSFGSVSIAESARDGQVGLAAPLSRVTIVIREGTQTFSTTTDSQGQYAFKEVAPGRYTLTVSELPGVYPITPATIQIKGPGACVAHTVTAVRRPPR